MRILLAEDDAATRLLIRRVLEREGYEVVHAEDGLEALECFARIEPDIVITDFQMPRMDGVQLCRELKALRGDRFIPIIMLTGGQDSDLLHNSLQAGALEFLSKPVKVDELVARVAAIAAMTEMHSTLAFNQQETLGEIAVVKHLLERLTLPGLKQLPPCFSMETLQTRRINGDACSYLRGIGGIHFGLLCDPTGHGLAAGVSTLPVLETFQTMAARDIPLESIYREINAKLCRLLPADRFACLIMLRLDPEIGLLTVLNAGMPDVLLFQKKEQNFRNFESRNFPGGILVDPEEIHVEDVTVAQGDRIFACSDGLLDLFEAPLIEDSFLRRGARYPVVEDHALLRSSISRCLGNAEQHDDLTWALWEVPPPIPLDLGQPALLLNPETREGLVLQFEMDPRIHQVRDLVPNILGLLGFKGVPPPALQPLGILLTEGFVNAVDHGLLGMDSTLKTHGFETYEACRKEALGRFQGGKATCRLSLHYTGEIPALLHHIHVEISDAGPGFDWKALPGPESSDLFAPHGRGIPLMKALSSDFRFNEAGNAVHFSLVF
jgi:CheY-like chemotaxis protein/anti-sigma regulatory factor (Ser/Thr protein kinase)